MKTTLALYCLAPDGDFQTERGDFPDTDAAWDHSNDMGSRWFFYPIHLVATSGRNARRAIIRDVPHGMPQEWVGRTVGRLIDALAADEQHACDYCNGETPFCVLP